MEENTNITNVEEIEETEEVNTEPEVLEEIENETTEVDVTTGVIVSAVALVALAGYGTYHAGKQAVKFVKRKIEEGKASFEERQAAAEEKKTAKALTRKQRKEALKQIIASQKAETEEE